MSTKSRGISAERELIHKFWAAGWAAMRAAGSGSIGHPSPDILAGNNRRKIAIECKITTATSKYFTKQEVMELKRFADVFGAEPWLAVRFFRQPWHFFTLDTATETGAHYVVTLAQAKSRGITFEELLE